TPRRRGNRTSSRRSWSSRGSQCGRMPSPQQPAKNPRPTPSTPPTAIRTGCGARHGQAQSSKTAAAVSAAAARASRIGNGSGMGSLLSASFLRAFKTDRDEDLVAEGLPELVHAELRLLDAQLRREAGALHSLGELRLPAAQQ